MIGFVTIFAIAISVLAIVLFVWSSRLKTQSGMPHGRIIYSDTGAWQRNGQSFFSRIHHVSGKPDYLVRNGKSIVPVEMKSGRAPVSPRRGHVLQLAAYCLLVEENLGVRPIHGIIKYAEKEFTIDYTLNLEQELLATLEEMRKCDELEDGPHRSHSETNRCLRCGVRDACNERLTD